MEGGEVKRPAQEVAKSCGKKEVGGDMAAFQLNFERSTVARPSGKCSKSAGKNARR